MVPLYAVHLSDLGPDDFVHVRCGCGHEELLSAAMLATAGLPPYTKVLALKRRLKCRECRWKGRAEVIVRVGGLKVTRYMR
jgi:hypothetical protein